MQNKEIPSEMRAVGLDEVSGQLMVKRVSVPVPARGEVLVKMIAAPVNPSDLARVKNLPVTLRSSFIGGIEGSGIVIACGGGILPRLWLNKRVACSSSHSESGTWAEYMVTTAMSCIPLPATVTDEQGSMMLVNPLTALAFIAMAGKGKHKAIINTAAAGSLGRMIAFLAGRQHIPVIHVVHTDKQEEWLTGQGIKYVLNSSLEKFPDELSKIAERLGATIVFDAVGGSFTGQMLCCTPYGSMHVIYGNLSAEQPIVDHRALVDDQKSVVGFYLVNWLKSQGLVTTLRVVLKARKILGQGLSIPVQETYPLEQVSQAINTYLGNMTAGKVLLIAR